jgi:glutaredoxin
MSVKLVWFGMPTCPHCQAFKKHLKKTKTENKLYCSKDREGQLMIEKWGVTNFPTLFFLNEDNKILDARVGFDSNNDDIRDVLKELEARE